MAAASLVLGILGVVCAIVPYGFYAAVPLGLAATVLGAIARKRAGDEPAGMATAGMVVGVVGVCLAATLITVCKVVLPHTSAKPKAGTLGGGNLDRP